MQVVYTHNNGNVTTFTANTAFVTASNVLLGNINRWTIDNLPELVTTLESTTTTKINGVEIINGIEEIVTFCYGDQVTYLTDYGFSVWAQERLTTEEYAIFQAQCAVWTGSLGAHPDPNLLFWWKKFEVDPNVVVTG